jgi:hypothetical protein
MAKRAGPIAPAARRDQSANQRTTFQSSRYAETV